MAQIDGGYCWVVVFCCFYGQLVGVGAFFSLGVFFPSWVDDFDSSRGLMSWVMTLGLGMNCMVGPIAASLVDKFGHRSMIIVGFLLSSIGVFLSAFVTSAYSLMILLGLIGGCGIGMFNLPSNSIIPLYFHKRRSLALAIVISGAAVGNFLFPPFFTWLEERMHWRGSLIIISGLMLNIIVCGALVRPVDHQSSEAIHDKKSEGSWRFQCKHVKTSTNSETHTSGFESQSSVDDQPRNQDDAYVSPGFESRGLENFSFIGDTGEGIGSSTKISNQSSHVNNTNYLHSIPRLETNGIKTQTAIAVCERDNSLSYVYLRPKGLNLSTRVTSELYKTLPTIGIPQKLEISADSSIVTVSEVPQSSTENTSENKQSAKSRNSSEKSLTCSCCTSWLSHLKGTMILLKNPYFAVFAVSSFLTYLTFLMPPVYMADRAIQNGVDKAEAALALSMYGAGNLFGRLGVGVVADRSILDSLTLNSICLIICGVSTCLSPLCGANAVLHGVYGFTFGTFIGGMVVLSPIILVELLGVSMLSSSLGLVFLFRSAGMILGTPVAGWIYDATNSYTASFLIHGTIIGVSGLVLAGLQVAVVISKRRAAAVAATAAEFVPSNTVFVVDIPRPTVGPVTSSIV